MNLQDIQFLLSGPQGWLLMGGGILLVLTWLVYRRMGKLAMTTRNDLAELRGLMTKLEGRLDETLSLVTSASTVVCVDESAPAMAESDTNESIDEAYTYEVSPVPEDDAALSEAGEEATSWAGSQPSEDLQAVAETLDEPFDDAYGYEESPAAVIDAESNQAVTQWSTEVDSDLDNASDAAFEVPGEFQFRSPVLPAESSEVFPVDSERHASEEQQTSFHSSEQPESFVFGVQQSDLSQSETLDEPITVAQPPSVGGYEPASVLSSEMEANSMVDSQHVSQVPTLESLSGDPDQPHVGVARCGECGRKIAYPKRLTGKRMRCPACKATSILP